MAQKQSESFSLFYSFALLYAELEDHSQAFINFMEAVSNDEVNGLDCEDLFWKCTTEDDYILRWRSLIVFLQKKKVK